MEKVSAAVAMVLFARQHAPIIALSGIRFDGRRAGRRLNSTDRPWSALTGVP